MSISISQKHLQSFKIFLTEDEKSKATLDKYMRDINYFVRWAEGRQIDKLLILSYKSHLEKVYAITSANSMLAALNSFLRFLGWHSLCVKQFKVQKNSFCPEEKELTRGEYNRLIEAAKRGGNERLALVIQTICATGIRVSELDAITVEAVKRGTAIVRLKGKTRTVFIVSALQKKLLCYIAKHNLTTGAVFVTRGGKPLNRSNIWKAMKALCEKAGVLAQKVFPHNLRHLFARTFYSIEKDIAKLADILGHSNINTTRIYIITTGIEHKRRMENMRLIM